MARVYLVHHGEAVGPAVDARRPLSSAGRDAVIRLAEMAAAKGVKPAVVWHSGKLRARQTAQEYWRACNALAEFAATRDLQPDDQPTWMRDRLLGETRDIMLVGHYPHLPALLSLLLNGTIGSGSAFPQHGIVAVDSQDAGETWKEIWRLEGTA
jgi:phosphohistidine phosphatase